MKQTSVFTLLITVCVLGSTANAARPSKACDRECLRGKVSELLYAFVKHDVSKLKVAPTLRVTEDAIVKPLAEVGLVKSVTGLAGYRQDIIDERAGVAGAHVIVKEGDASVMLVARVKVVANALTEVELVAFARRRHGRRPRSRACHRCWSRRRPGSRRVARRCSWRWPEVASLLPAKPPATCRDPSS